MNHISAFIITIAKQTLVILSITIVLVSCNQSTKQQSQVNTHPETIPLPTAAPPPQPSPSSTRVMPITVLTPPPESTITPIPAETYGLVIDVIDGDTIAVVMDGDPLSVTYEVRYLGIDAPANDSSEPWGVVAYEKNHKLANLKVVKLVRDETDFDAEGYLLRYVYVDNTLLNSTLVEQGLAKAAITSPNDRLKTNIERAENKAKTEKLGLWSNKPPTSTPALSRAVESTDEPEDTPPPAIKVSATITGTTTIAATKEAITTTSTSEAIVTGTIEPTSEATSESE